MGLNYIVLVLFAAAFVMSVVLHEVAHGYVARLCGDPTAEIAGRLTLNPIKHIDPIMTIAVPLVLLYVSGGRVFFGGARPVPVNPYLLRNGEVDDLKVSLAGVTTNFTMALVFGWSLHLWRPGEAGFTLFALIAIANLMLGMFNLIPVPPLDGSHVVRFLLARVAPEAAAAYQRIGMFGIVLVMLFWSFFGRFIFIAVTFVWDKVLLMGEVPWWDVISQFRATF